MELTNDKRLILADQHFDRQYLRYKEHFTRFCRLNPVKKKVRSYILFKKILPKTAILQEMLFIFEITEKFVF